MRAGLGGRRRRVPRSLRGLRPGSVPGGGPTGSAPIAGFRGRPLTRRSAWRRVQVRRVAAAALVGLATWLVVSAVLPHPVEVGVPVVVVGHDLATGARVGPTDVRLERRPLGQRPASAVTDLAEAVGQVVSGPVGAGELLTTTRFRGPSSLAGLTPTRVAMSIPLVDDGLTPVLRPGDRVTVLTPGTGASVARAAPVVAVVGPGGGWSDGGGVDGAGGLGLGAGSGGGAGDGAGGRVVLGLTGQEAAAAAAAMGGATGLTGFVLTLGGG